MLRGNHSFSDDQSLKALGIKHFKTMFEDDKMTNLESQLKVIRLFPSFISTEDKDSFSIPVSIQEVERALKLFKKDKAPGPDGWPVEFFLFFFDLMGPLLVNVVESARTSGRVAPALNSTFIALILEFKYPCRRIYTHISL